MRWNICGQLVADQFVPQPDQVIRQMSKAFRSKLVENEKYAGGQEQLVWARRNIFFWVEPNHWKTGSDGRDGFSTLLGVQEKDRTTFFGHDISVRYFSTTFPAFQANIFILGCLTRHHGFLQGPGPSDGVLSSDPPISNTPIGKWFQYPPWETLVYWIDERGGPQWRYFRGRGLLGTEGCPLLDWATPDWQRLEPRWHPVGPISFAARMQQIKGWRTVEFCSWVIPLVQKPDLVWNLIESNYAFRRPIHGGSRLKIEQLRLETDTFESTNKAAYSPLGCMAGHVWAVSCVLRCFESYRVVRAEALDFFRMIMTSSIQRRVLRDDWAGLVVFFTALSHW